MKYTDLQNNLEKIFIFSTNDLKLLDDKYEKSKLSKWKKLGYIKQIIRGFFVLGKIDINTSLIYKMANTIYSPSYISLESAFCYYSLIPEQAFLTSSITTKKTNTFHTEFGSFEYKKVKNELFFGYDIKIINNQKILIASLEKALLDYFYLYNNVSASIDIEYLRFNKTILQEKLDIHLLKKYGNLLNSRVVNKRIELLVNYINND